MLPGRALRLRPACGGGPELLHLGMVQSYPTLIPGLRSPSAVVDGLVYFGRMLDKIRLHAAGQLPAAYQANLGDAQTYVLDGRCCRFLR